MPPHLLALNLLLGTTSLDQCDANKIIVQVNMNKVNEKRSDNAVLSLNSIDIYFHLAGDKSSISPYKDLDR